MCEKIRWVALPFLGLYAAKLVMGPQLPTLVRVFQFAIFIGSIILGATIIHELSHCWMARIWTSDCTIEWKLSLQPGTAIFHSPHEIPTPRFKLVGAAPLGAGLSGLFLSAIFIFSGFSYDSIPLIVMVGLSGGLLASISDSDEFAIRHPAAFQEYASDHDQWNSDVAQEYI